jgi:hypothetical protein
MAPGHLRLVRIEGTAQRGMQDGIMLLGMPALPGSSLETACTLTAITPCFLSFSGERF